MLSKVIQHDKWLTLLDAAIEFDRTAVDTPIHHREATRIISASQFGAGSWLGASPDASPSCPKLHSPAHLIMLQRRLGLYLSAAKTANDALAASRDERDRRLTISTPRSANFTQSSHSVSDSPHHIHHNISL